MFHLDTLSRAFPNVRDLVLSHFLQPIGQSHSSHPHDTAHWANLDTVEVDAPLPLNRPIRNLHLQYIDEGPFLPLLRQFLATSAPVSLACYAEASIVECIVAAAPSVRFLQLSCSPNCCIPQDAIRTLVCTSCEPMIYPSLLIPTGLNRMRSVPSWHICASVLSHTLLQARTRLMMSRNTPYTQVSSQRSLLLSNTWAYSEDSRHGREIFPATIGSGSFRVRGGSRPFWRN